MTAFDRASSLAFRHIRQAACRHCFCFCELQRGESTGVTRCCRCQARTLQPTLDIHRPRSRDAIGRWLL